VHFIRKLRHVEGCRSLFHSIGELICTMYTISSQLDNSTNISTYFCVVLPEILEECLVFEFIAILDAAYIALFREMSVEVHRVTWYMFLRTRKGSMPQIDCRACNLR
jgi:hypothetical protein